MSEIIEHEEDVSRSVQVGDQPTRVSLKVYQDVYHQVTGKTEQIKQRYSENILVEFSEIEQLHHKIHQLCDVHNVVASSLTISLFHQKERKEQFTSFERFRAYNSNSTSPTVTVVLKYNFSIIPAGLERPQEYVVTVRLTSRVAVAKEMESDAPPFMRGRVFGIFAGSTAEISIDYADYIIARGFLEACNEWIHGCKVTPDIPAISFAQRYSHFIPVSLKTIVSVAMVYFALEAIPVVKAIGSSPDLWARFAVIFGGAFYVFLSITGIIGRVIENCIDSYGFLSYIKMNKGDEKLIEEYKERNKSTVRRFILSTVLSIVIGVISKKIALLI